MIELLVSLLIFCLIAGLIWWAISTLPIPEPFRTVMVVILVLIFVLVLLSYLPIGPFHWRAV